MTLRFAATLGMLVLLASCAGPAGHAATPEPTPGAAEAHWIELDAFEKSVPPAPITVVFDIDDTALYSSHAMLLAEGAFHLQHPEDGHVDRDGGLQARCALDVEPAPLRPPMGRCWSSPLFP